MTKIFLSYRREDSADVAGRIFDHLERRFGREQLFLDVDSIQYGDDFRRRIDDALSQTGLLLAIIGDRWLTATDKASPTSTRRLDDPDDYVAVEISAALQRGITVLPVLVGEAEMPRAGDLPAHLAELSFRNAAEVRSGRDFQLHIHRLIEAIANQLKAPEQGRRSPRGHAPAPSLPTSFAALERDPNELVGAQLGAFMIERLLAAGGSGLAYVARNPRTGHRVCVKVSLPVLSDMERIRTAVSRGIRGLVALNHPHIVRVHEFDGLDLTDARSFYVVMDHVQGARFDEWAAALSDDRNGRRAFVRIAHLIARALEAAHTCRYLDDAGFETVGVMHGDIKPGNIVVRPDGTPALMDFMLVDVHRVLDPKVRERFASSGANITEAFGTPGFMAPEQELNGIVTVRSDVYGLGATLRAAAGRLSLPGDLESLLLRMTGSLEDRPADMGVVARLLTDIARRENLESAEMKRQQPEETGARRGLLSVLASLFTREAAAPPANDRVAAARTDVARTSSTHPEIPAVFRLRVLTGPHAGILAVLSSARVTVGRSEHNDVVLARETFLSRSHFGLNWSADQRTFVAIDFGANAPVLVNGEPLVGSRSLAPGDVLAVGPTQLVFERTEPLTTSHH